MKKITTKIVQRHVCNFEILTAKSTVRDNVDELMIEVSFYENFNIKSDFVHIAGTLYNMVLKSTYDHKRAVCPKHS